jgi:hypothetical protein
MFVVISDAAR